MNPHSLTRLIQEALLEDIPSKDLTTESTVPSGSLAKGTFSVKEPLIVAGLSYVPLVFDAVAKNKVQVTSCIQEGAKVEKGTILAEVEGCAKTLLQGERVALNLLQRLCGIATLTDHYLAHLPKGSRAQLVDTRKTTPGLRTLEKYAVRMGGGKKSP